MKKSLVSGILNVVTGLIIFLHVSRHMNGLSVPFLSAMKGQYILWSLKGDSSAHLDLLRLASAAAAWRSWVDLLTGTPNTALWVTSLRMRLWPLFGAVFGDEGGVSEPALWIPRLLIYIKKILKKGGKYEEMSFWTTGRNREKCWNRNRKKEACNIHRERESVGEEDLKFLRKPNQREKNENDYKVTRKWQWGTFILCSV